ncbi:MAG: ribbon-helix-helix protein, CopG family [Bdellovibrionales bacterium]|nr:ribbon-helix-helix protein, CopG family [Bdellovibrionales bacterium]
MNILEGRNMLMKANNTEKRGMKSQGTSSVRASISFPPELYQQLEEIAREKKVSLAWVVRDAAEHYVTDYDEAERDE